MARPKEAVTRSCCHLISVRVATALLVVVIAASTYFMLTWYVGGHLLMKFIERYDVAFLGVHIDLDRLQLDPFKGVVTAAGLKVSNPSGGGRLLTVASISLDVDLGKFLWTLGNRLEVNSLLVEGLAVVYEQSSSSSNVG